MKKRMRLLLLALAMTLSLVPAALAAPATATAMPTNDKLTVDGVLQNPTVYKINDSNYFKIRDLAAILNGTSKQFVVGYDAANSSVTATTGQGYTKLSTDLVGAPTGGNKTATLSTDVIYVNGKRTQAEVYKIDGSNYFKLRDLGDALGFAVDWNQTQGMLINTGSGTQSGKGTGTRTDPLACDGSTAIRQNRFSSIDPVREFKLACVGELTGKAANQLALAENPYNTVPNESREWRFYEFELTYLSSTDGPDDQIEAADIIFKSDFFDRNGASVGEGVTVDDIATLGDRFGGMGIYDVQLYPGSSSKVVFCFRVKKDAGDLLFRVPNEKEGKTTWMLCSPGTEGIFAKYTSNSSTPSTPSTPDKPGGSAGKDESATYADFPNVPDFGAVFGVKPASVEKKEDGSVTYTYNAADVFGSWVNSDLLTETETISTEVKYTKLLEQHGFTQMSSKPLGSTTYGNFRYYTNAPGGSINGSLTYNMSVSLSCGTFYLNGVHGMILVTVKSYNR